jgi:hypothetical protein
MIIKATASIRGGLHILYIPTYCGVTATYYGHSHHVGNGADSTWFSYYYYTTGKPLIFYKYIRNGVHGFSNYGWK